MARGEAVLLCDIGRIGPKYLPGHAHADTLSFELSLAGTRVIVNSGTSEYGLADERLRQRGTAAHSTVVVGDTDSSEVWSGFRVARRARVDAIETSETPQGLTVSATHDGYIRLPNGPRHSRRWTLTESGLRIHDSLDQATRGEARYHLPPGVSTEIVMADTEPSGCCFYRAVGALHWHASGTPESISPHGIPAGESQPCTCLVLTLQEI